MTRWPRQCCPRKNRVLNCPHFTLRAGAPEGRERIGRAKTSSSVFSRIWNGQICAQSSAQCWTRHFTATPLELVWKFAGDWWHLVDIVARPFQWFPASIRKTNLSLSASTAPIARSPLISLARQVCLRHTPCHIRQPIRLCACFSRCLWPVSFKRGGLGFTPRFVERHGMPWRVVGRPHRRHRKMTSAALPAIFPAWFRMLWLSFPTARKSSWNPRARPRAKSTRSSFPAGQGDFQDSHGPDADSRDGGQEQPGGGADPQRSGRGAGGFRQGYGR